MYRMAYDPNNQNPPINLALELRPTGVHRKFNGAKVGVVHGIWNTNMNAICTHLGYTPVAKYYKEVSQDDIRMAQKVTGYLLIWPGGPIWILLTVGYVCGWFDETMAELRTFTYAAW